VARGGSPCVAASSEWVDDDGVRMPAGDVHAWEPGTNQTLCGMALSRSQLRRFPHVRWPEIDPATGGAADEVRRVCPRCRAATGGGRRKQRDWTRIDPRP